MYSRTKSASRAFARLLACALCLAVWPMAAQAPADKCCVRRSHSWGGSPARWRSRPRSAWFWLSLAASAKA